VPSQLPVHASKLYSANIAAFLKVLIGEGGEVRADEKAIAADEILDATCVTLDGTVRHGPTLALLQADTP
jgi:H+-translocating NAD(P) transhydrogenase subunit alpha